MRHPRSDSVTAAVQAAQAVASGPIEPPAHVRLREGDRPFWDAVVAARATVTWHVSDLEMAGNLCRAKSDIERLQADIDREGDVIVNARGTLVANPKHAVLETLSRRAVALSRLLHVHAEATNGRSRDQIGKLAAQRQAEAAFEALGDHDDLIPGLAAWKRREGKP
jgi:hypothetical protein